MTATAAVGCIVVSISSFSIVRAERVVPANSVDYNCSSGTACVTGSSTGSTTWGAYGLSNSADGVHGRTNSTTGNSAVAGIARGRSGRGQGVYGNSSNGDGVQGVATDATDAGVYGTGGEGVIGYSKTGWGVIGESDGSPNGSGVFAALASVGTGTKTALFYALNNVSQQHCEIDAQANLTCTGTIGASSLRERHRNSNGQRVLSYASQSATATIEDVGTARMSGGVANVRIDPAFASVMDRKWYYVFLTPLGDTRGLYVSMKTATAFQVRENERGRSNVEFDYRIVAHPLDADDDRLPPAPEIRRPASVIPPAH